MGITRNIREKVVPLVPEPMINSLRHFTDEWPLFRFQWFSGVESPTQRLDLVRRLRLAHAGINCAHTHHEIVSMIDVILALPSSRPGCIVEAGCFKGGSTAKLSIAAKIAGRKLVVFDSFEGLPDNRESHDHDIFGLGVQFEGGKYSGQLAEVAFNVERFGEPSVCEFRKGWFEDSMPDFHEPVALAFLDVDLASSTRTCLRYLYPLLTPGCSIFSHDGHLPLCIQAMDDSEFWEREVGFPKPAIPGLGKKKLIRIIKPGVL